jgi:hypothetical protein
MKLEFSWQIVEKYNKIYENPSSGSRVVPHGWLERYAKANSHILQFCEHS